ncbi:ribosome recycling factor, putative [Babesia ovis]|uniref:Ribosome recycling factor, putative n=1 Tax=Babesia ovis TaxID=5869 RepID=A0A9W5TBN0_BABOV|nr:ribosome recycling factor, putative [Babesia ovis]
MPYRVQQRLFASKHKKAHKGKASQREEADVEDDLEYFDIEEHLDHIGQIEEAALSALAELKPTALTLEDFESTQIKDKLLVDLAQIVVKSPIVTHLHVFDTKLKSRVVRELTLLRDDWTIQSDEGDLIVVRSPSPTSPQVIQQVTQRANAVVEAHNRLLQRAISKAASKIKQVNIGNNWHKKQSDQLEAAAKRVRERMKAVVKDLVSH